MFILPRLDLAIGLSPSNHQVTIDAKCETTVLKDRLATVDLPEKLNQRANEKLGHNDPPVLGNSRGSFSSGGTKKFTDFLLFTGYPHGSGMTKYISLSVSLFKWYMSKESDKSGFKRFFEKHLPCRDFTGMDVTFLIARQGSSNPRLGWVGVSLI
ncbi:uncharacterized protein MELLADRAFT_101699 [Melampsora larici-populina 98AG31]|uniref:Uncharacterized protein n=1 Tax=Melampsora larici-populina (strain 98AG31 / pathotype 3-4-7) TaxID=747676 RepID=F4R6P3_MELLP|nr:uncharacterized protein MELLADRAFT_101699 [Melampsora larici-populina 98AG31]EGG11912.1 hypothetical protein MELLADRAFT_101699 [Melampsora larici-populina 98AG31]